MAKDQSSGGKKHSKKISILMRASRENALVEFPINSVREDENKNGSGKGQSKTLGASKKLLNAKTKAQ